MHHMCFLLETLEYVGWEIHPELSLYQGGIGGTYPPHILRQVIMDDFQYAEQTKSQKSSSSNYAS